MTEHKLETPRSADALYDTRGEDVNPLRPTFTGDVHQLDGSGLVMLVQHPCALRRGVPLVPKLLAVGVEPGRMLRNDWVKISPKLMPLPRLDGDRNFVGDFIEPRIVGPIDLLAGQRIATLSQLGVNLILQRLVYHNSRVIIPTFTYDEQTIGPYTEADLATEWCESRADTIGAAAAMAEFDRWIRTTPDDTDVTWQQMLNNDQERSAVRREMRRQLRAIP